MDHVHVGLVGATLSPHRCGVTAEMANSAEEFTLMTSAAPALSGLGIV